MGLLKPNNIRRTPTIRDRYLLSHTCWRITSFYANPHYFSSHTNFGEADYLESIVLEKIKRKYVVNERNFYLCNNRCIWIQIYETCNWQHKIFNQMTDFFTQLPFFFNQPYGCFFFNVLKQRFSIKIKAKY